jgi:lactate dehydrogenase-like 2-hydroxyacid dehydrogenase
MSLGARIVYFDLNKLPSDQEAKLGASYSPLARLLSESDVVSIHLPLTGETRKIIGEKELRVMKPTGVFVNTARGELVDEAALAKAVSEGWIAGAGVDVFTVEPPPGDNPLLVAAREGAPLVLTPHIAGATNEARIRIIQATIENILGVMLGKPPVNVVN